MQFDYGVTTGFDVSTKCNVGKGSFGDVSDTDSYVPVRQLSLKCLYIKDEEDVKREVVNLFTIYIPGHWRQLKIHLCPEVILNDLLKLKFINIEEHKKYSEQEKTDSNLFILQKMSTEYMEMNSGKVKGVVFKNLLEKQPKNVRAILSEEVVVRRWPKRDPQMGKSRLEETANLIDEIPLPVDIEELIECFIFSVNDYVKINEVSVFADKRKYVRSLLIKYLHRGSFEYLLEHSVIADLKEDFSPGICNIDSP
ncbi:unnamed protein product [Mytilus coruscus]|uniref:Uncharacterized protein n=1 Tax=Mytilus coruscus TaxID=42192 RepID=A0A6J8A1D6_MYTCO|nr:unnamed protein product [Mytilus coruscus]